MDSIEKEECTIFKNILIEDEKLEKKIQFNKFKIQIEGENISFQKLIKELKKQEEFIFSSGFLISYWDDVHSKYVCIGNDPLQSSMAVPLK